MTIGSALDYICFTCIRCNGTTLIAEIHRLIMNDTDMYLSRLRSHSSLYEFLYSVAVDIQGPECVGSCTEKRFQYSQGSNSTKWNIHQNDLLDLILDSFYVGEDNRSSKSSYDRSILVLMEHLLKKDPFTQKKKYCGIGNMGCIQFVHLSSLLGLIPLYCSGYNRISSMKLGPAKFITRSLLKDLRTTTVEECNNEFEMIHSEFRDIWGMKITSSLLENTLCELWSSYKKTVDGNKKANETSEWNVDVITNSELFIDSRVNDVYYFDERRSRIQNFFCIQTSGNGINELRPALIMKHSGLWGTDDNKSKIRLTSWTQDSNDRKHLLWADSFEERTIYTELQVSDYLKNLFVLP